MVSLPAMAVTWPPAPKIQAKSWVMLDAKSGQIITSHDSDLELPPASLTKMMTLYIAFEDLKLGRLSLDEKVSVSTKAWKIGGSRMFIEPRMQPTVDEILHGIATLSGNDACVALAEHISASEEVFAERMNQKARELGMTHSQFMNATGFPEAGHYSSAMDMARLGAALWREFPKQYKLFAERSYTYNNITQPNRNRLLWSDPRVDGIKTGHTEEAGFCLVGSAEKDSTRFVTAVFGADSERERERQTRILLNYGFRNFVSIRPAERDIRRQVEVFEGVENMVWVRPSQAMWVTVPKGLESKIAFRLRYDAPLKAPISKGQKIGTIEAVVAGKGSEPGEVLATVSVGANRTVEQASWLGRQWDGVRLWWRNSSAEATDAAK
ncbi:MAG: D-alanyl-D-alanine carboxypeptidase family protein [Mariprofundaceae bacterium]